MTGNGIQITPGVTQILIKRSNGVVIGVVTGTVTKPNVKLQVFRRCEADGK